MISCFEIVSASVDIATKNNNTLKINKSGFESVKSICQLMDDILRNFDTISFGVDIAKDCSVITMSFECNDYNKCLMSKDFKKILDIANHVSVERSKDRKEAKISFDIPGVWSHT